MLKNYRRPEDDRRKKEKKIFGEKTLKKIQNSKVKNQKFNSKVKSSRGGVNLEF